jgi:L-malate glycosyltransferase
MQPVGNHDKASELHLQARIKKARPVRVCIVGPSPDMVGGQAVQAQRLRTRLARSAGIEVSFLSASPHIMGPLRFLQRVKYVRTVVNSFVYGLSLLCRLPRMDVVHAFSASYWSFLLAPVPAMLVGRLFRKGVILNYRSGEADDHLTHWRTAVPLMRLAHSIVVPSDYLVGVFARHGLRATAIPNFVEIERFPYRQRDTLRPLFLSNRGFEALYNVSCVLRAFRRIQSKMPEAKLVVAGDGPLRAQLQDEARDLGLRNVTFCGAVKQDRMATLYDEADVYLNAPDIDNMPNSILEAAACGLPIVTSDAGGIPFIVRNEVTALLTSRNDDAALAAAAIRLFEEPGLASRLSAAAHSEVLHRYTWPAAEAGWLDTYHRAARRMTRL